MLPSTKLTIGDVLLIIRRRAAVVLITAALVSAAIAAATRLLPNRYRSETLILVVPQRVPESYVKSTVTAKIEDRLNSISQQILSRTRLERIIDDFNLYADERRTRLMEMIVEEMRSNIDIKVVKGDAFRVAYVGDDAPTVMKVTTRLASLFIEENLRDREELAEGTNHFLEAQLVDARRRLIDHEKKLEQYRNRFAGELPSQLTPNLQVIQNVQLQLQSLTDALNRDVDRRALIDRQLRETEREIEAQSSLPPAASAADAADAPAAGSTAAQQLTAARMTLANLERRLRPAHPDVQRMRRSVSDLEAAVALEASEPAAHAVAIAPPSPAELMRQARAADLRMELGQVERQLALRNAEEQRLQGIVRDYQERIERVPARESELAELTRDYSTLQTLYQTLLAKQEESKIAANLERRQVSAQFKLLDPARLAEKPFGPRRRLIAAAGVAAGLCFGLALVALLEYRDRTFKTDADISNELRLPVLAVVPWMPSEGEERRAARRRFAVISATGAAVSGCIAVIVYSVLH
jgi:polysaccharide chain length determinant protein (PEP-CTERM system associated)